MGWSDGKIFSNAAPFTFGAIRGELGDIRKVVVERFEREKSNSLESGYVNTDMKSVRTF